MKLVVTGLEGGCYGMRKGRGRERDGGKSEARFRRRGERLNPLKGEHVTNECCSTRSGR